MLNRARTVSQRADRIISREQELIRTNRFGPKIALALREARR